MLKECERRRVSETLHILSRLRLLPVTSEEIGNAVAQFHLLPPRVGTSLHNRCGEMGTEPIPKKQLKQGPAFLKGAVRLKRQRKVWSEKVILLCWVL